MQGFCVLSVLLAVGLAGCSGEPNAARVGGEGSNCLTTSDCPAPLECFGNVCVNLNAQADATAIGQEDVTTGPADDTATTQESPDVVESDVAAPEDVPAVEDDGPEPDDIPTSEPDMPLPEDANVPPQTNDTLNPVGDCEGVGVASSWVGTFDGEVAYNLGMPIPGLIEKDILDVSGDLSFTIKCIEKKLVVLGEMDGLALGANPFTLKLSGGYNPETETLTAKMIEGKVIIFAFVEVFFEGDFIGKLTPTGDMTGTWDGESTGNSLMLGMVADGVGTWAAEPQ